MNNSKGKTALILETRKHKALEFVLNNFMTNISDEWSFLLFCGNLNEDFCKDILSRVDTDRIQLINMGVDTMTWSEYNRYFSTDLTFYSYIPTEIFLVFQTDSMIFSKYKENINDFLKYDYVGAPWNNDRFGGVGNGGLSLRRKSKMLEIIETVNYLGEAEDIYFCNNMLVELYRPTMEEAKHFSVEEVFHPTSFGCHKPWDRGFDKELLDVYPEIKVLFELNDILVQVPKA